jgi:hypothetical protein
LLALYDDGSSLTTNPQGVVTSVTDSSGAAIAVAAPDSGIAQQFANMVTYGVSSLINHALPPAPLPASGVQRPAASDFSALLASPVVRIGALALLGFFLYKKFA